MLEQPVQQPKTYDIITNPGQALRQVREWQGQGLKVAITDVVCDILHYRHFEYFEAIKQHADKLLVRVDTSELVQSKKDSRGSIVPLEYRLKALAHIRTVDLLTVKNRMGLEWVDIYKPDIVIKSTTSGVKVVKEIEELASLQHQPELILFDQDNNLVPLDRAEAEARAYDDNKYSGDKFSGSIIKQEIKDRFQEDIAEYLTCDLTTLTGTV
jgi:glycerol-3-phosphate cytidylyltransferase-like family protein